MSWTSSRRRSRRLTIECLFLFPCVRRIGGKETLGGLERWFSPRGQDMAFLLSRIGLVRPRSEMIKIKSNQIWYACAGDPLGPWRPGSTATSINHRLWLVRPEMNAHLQTQHEHSPKPRARAIRQTGQPGRTLLQNLCPTMASMCVNK
jgi:hypothetical protein